MSNIRLIATDLDGTFFDAHSQIIPANVDAFRQAQASGIAVAICSGRCPVDIRYVHRQMGLDTWIIGFNGAVVREPGAPADIFCQPLERPALERLLTFLEEDQDVYYNMCTVGLRYLMARGRHRARAESGRLHLGAHGVQTHFIDSWREIPEAELDRCMKVIASSPDRSEAERLKRDAAGAGFPLTITSSWWNNIEVVARGVDKGVGIQRLCDHLGISTADVMVLGDQKNDLPMFRVAGWPVAMANGDEAVKAAARIVTASNDEAGVAQAVRRYALRQP